MSPGLQSHRPGERRMTIIAYLAVPPGLAPAVPPRRPNSALPFAGEFADGSGVDLVAAFDELVGVQVLDWRHFLQHALVLVHLHIALQAFGVDAAEVFLSVLVFLITL